MAKGEVIIDEGNCRGCGYCVEYCPKGCIAITGEKLTSQGYLQPTFIAPDKCTGCGICGWMCPDFAIEVYKYVEATAPAAA